MPARERPAPPASAAAVASQAPATPDTTMPALFQAVQRSQLFDDQKTFPDLQPQQAPSQIEADYLARRDTPGFALKTFVDSHFRATPPPTTPALAADASLAAHIDALWPLLSRDSRQVPTYSSQLPLPRPYVVPGGRFGEMYYWDSYFTMVGLHASGEASRARDMLEDFAHLIDHYGHIPNGTRSYYLSRSQPPFFSHMVELEAAQDGPSLRVRYLPQLRREYAYWMAGAQDLAPGQASQHVVRLADCSVLNRYWDALDTPRTESYLQDVRTAAEATDRPATEVYRDLRAAAESGWDFSSRWLGDRQHLRTIRTTAIVPVDLNSLLYHLETTIAVACEQVADAGCSRDFRAHAQARRQAMQRYLWNPSGFWADYDWMRRKTSDQPTAAMFFPLYAGLSSPAQARDTARIAQSQLLTPAGLATTRERTGQQWDAPNLWAPLQWVAVQGLQRYGEHALAERIARGFLAQVETVYTQDRKLVEKYSSDADTRGGGGEYPLQDGFGWSNGVTRALMIQYPAPAARPDR
ncbi:alpha,alpha-trehalase TreA [Stenotrophomonas sp. HITSZ_GD]|uniref:alpha,alpha-trehalase TreA n=1 Tax=Stenotrophomonas sp. HITSZ_GD TaxID=3037248 RepID=UPI0031F2DD80